MDSGEEEFDLNGIAFLQGNVVNQGHDDDPDRTMNRIVELVRNGGERYWYWLPKYGPRARPHVDLLLAKPDRKSESEKWSQLQALADVGGEKAMERLVDEVGSHRQEVRQRGVDPAGNLARLSDREERNAVVAYRACRWGVGQVGGTCLCG